MAICKNIEKSNILLSNNNSSLFCRYHRRKKSRSVDLIKPKGLCAEAFHQMYPTLFSMISAPYPELRSDPIVMRCPATKSKVEFELFRGPATVLNRCVNAIKRLAGFFYKAELREHRIYIRLRSARGPCPYKFKEGDVFEFNLDGWAGICPAAFNNIFPSLVSRIYGFKDNEKDYFACPDHKTNILFSINESEKEHESLKYGMPCCESLDNLEIYVKDVAGSCRAGFKKGDSIKIRDILKKIGIPCASLVHTVYPYLLTSLKDGKLGYRAEDYNSVTVQCPNAKSRVELYIHKSSKTQFIFSVKSVKETCPLGLNAGDRFCVDTGDLEELCISSFVCLYPYFLIYPYKQINEGLRCPGPDGVVTFILNEIEPAESRKASKET